MADNKTKKNSGFRWFINEIIKMYSSQDSFFSKKRVESAIAFIVAQMGMITYFIVHISAMDIYDLIMWAGVEFTVAGYMIYKIENVKMSSLKKELKDAESTIQSSNDENTTTDSTIDTDTTTDTSTTTNNSTSTDSSTPTGINI